MHRNIALLGCGAIAHDIYLPALAGRRKMFDSIWLVDPADSALNQAQPFLDAKTAHRLSEVTEELKFVIIASPNSLHFSMAKEALARGAHVLIEKPFVIWPEEGRELLALSRSANRVVAVNQPRRIFHNTLELRKRFLRGDFGDLRAIEHSEGNKLRWPFRSGAAFAPTAQRVGVIMDIGVHVLDMYQYLFTPQWTVERAVHDGFRGPEGLARISLKADRAPTSIRLSRYQRQENLARLTFDACEIVVPLSDTTSYVEIQKKRVIHRRSVSQKGSESVSAGEIVLDNFVGATEGREEAFCCIAKSLPVIELLDQVYRSATHFPATLGAV